MKPWRHRLSPPAKRQVEIKDVLGIITSIITAVAAVFAGLKYVFGFFSAVELEIELSPLIEFRCSKESFNAVDCINGKHPDSAHLTLTAGLFLRAVGDQSKEATITEATVNISNLPKGEEGIQPAPTLTWLWSGDFVPGRRFERTQVTALSLRGGESKSQELWFFPIDESCGVLSLDSCKNSRQNFISWVKFTSDLALTSTTISSQRLAYRIDFKFKFREGGRAGEQLISCAVEISHSVRKMADPLFDQRNGVLVVSAPCRRLTEEKST